MPRLCQAYRERKIRDRELQHNRKRNWSVHGGDYHKTRFGRSRPRPVGEGVTMNLTLRSTQARGQWSFRNERNWRAITTITAKFCERFNVRVVRLSNVGNHLHFHVLFMCRKSYVKFIRALTSAIASAITGCSRWTKGIPTPFWDQRPFTRLIRNIKEWEIFDRYLDLNDLEGEGFPRIAARALLKLRRAYRGIDLTKMHPA